MADYYTGIIWEVVAPGMPGSIASGGRYDRLVGSLGGPDLPACGGSLGIERILALVAGDQPVSDGLDVAITVIDQARPVRDMVTGEQTRAPVTDVALALGQRSTLSSAGPT